MVFPNRTLTYYFYNFNMYTHPVTVLYVVTVCPEPKHYNVYIFIHCTRAVHCTHDVGILCTSDRFTYKNTSMFLITRFFYISYIAFICRHNNPF